MVVTCGSLCLSFLKPIHSRTIAALTDNTCTYSPCVVFFSTIMSIDLCMQAIFITFNNKELEYEGVVGN